MTATLIVAVVLSCGAAVLLVWGPRLTSAGISTEPKKQPERCPCGEHAASPPGSCPFDRSPGNRTG